MGNLAIHGDGGMHRAIVGYEVPCLFHALGVKCIPNYLNVHSDVGKNPGVLVALLGGDYTVVTLDALALALTDTMEREDGTLPECHQHSLHRGRLGVGQACKHYGICV